MPWDAATILLVAACLHVGFQATVTVTVYPALAAVPEEAWEPNHDAHSRRISVLVAPLYGLIVAASAWSLATGPSPATGVAVAGLALAVGTTAAVAAPLHGRLGREGPRPELLRRLLRADRVRLAGAVVGLAGSLAAVAD